MEIEDLLAEIFIRTDKITIVTSQNNVVPPPNYVHDESLIQEIASKIKLSEEESSLFILVCRCVKNKKNAILDFQGCVEFIKEINKYNGEYDDISDINERLVKLLHHLNQKGVGFVSIIKATQNHEPVLFFLKMPHQELSIKIYQSIKIEEKKEYQVIGKLYYMTKDIFIKKHNLNQKIQNLDTLFQHFQIEKCTLTQLKSIDKYTIIVISLFNEDIVVSPYFSIDMFLNDLLQTVNDYYFESHNNNFAKVVLKNVAIQNPNINATIVKDILNNRDYQSRYFIVIIQIIANLIKAIKVKKMIDINKKGTFQRIYIASQLLFYLTLNENKDQYKKKKKEQQKQIEKQAIIKFLLTQYIYDNQLNKNIYAPVPISNICEISIQSRDIDTGKLNNYYLYDFYTEESLADFLKSIIFSYTKKNFHQIFFLKYKDVNCYFHIGRVIDIVYSMIDIEKKKISNEMINKWQSSKYQWFFFTKKRFNILIDECVSNDFKKLLLFIQNIFISIKSKKQLQEYLFLSENEVRKYHLERSDLVLENVTGEYILINQKKRLVAFLKMLFQANNTLKPYHQIISLSSLKFLKKLRKRQIENLWNKIIKKFFSYFWKDFITPFLKQKKKSYQAVPIVEKLFEEKSLKKSSPLSSEDMNLQNIDNFIEEQHKALNKKVGKARQDFREILDEYIDQIIAKVDPEVFTGKKIEIIRYMTENLPIIHEITNKEALIKYVYLKGLKKVM